MVHLSLGPLTLEAFEVPSRVRLGGAQALAVHKLPGGVRVIDAMGRDDADVVWSGYFAGPSAGVRARLLDALRVAGAALPLSWDAFCYSVIISEASLDYHNPWWIGYRIVCKVVVDLARGVPPVADDFGTAVLDDLASASGFFDLADASAASAAPGALAVGTQAHQSALVSLTTAGSTIQSNITVAEAGLQGSDVASLVASSQSLAQLCCAQGYVGRATTNLEDASD
jgi:hypothetical protein